MEERVQLGEFRLDLGQVRGRVGGGRMGFQELGEGLRVGLVPAVEHMRQQAGGIRGVPHGRDGHELGEPLVAMVEGDHIDVDLGQLEPLRQGAADLGMVHADELPLLLELHLHIRFGIVQEGQVWLAQHRVDHRQREILEQPADEGLVGGFRVKEPRIVFGGHGFAQGGLPECL